MKAMILAAGLGTRLRPLTDDRPKALVEVAGRTLLEIVIRRLAECGVTDVIVNAHYFADQIVDFLAVNKNFGMHIEVSREEVLLDTGGGLKKAAHFFLGSEQEPFILHNVDVLSNLDLGRMIQFHTSQNALATLAVQGRPTSRPLLFDENGRLCGRQRGPNKEPQLVRICERPTALAFSGIHVISPQLLEKIEENGAFSIIDAYLNLAAKEEKIIAYHTDGCYWRDLGRPESIAAAAKDIADGRL
jgi:NDP-sugar pyrophosphorylase family protein